MVVRVQGGIITNQVLEGTLRYFEIGDSGGGPFEYTLGGYPSSAFTADNYEERADSASIIDAGSGYAIGDVLTVSGGAAIAADAATFTVAAVDGSGGVTNVTPLNDGDYQISPANPASTTTGGGGTNCTLNVIYTGMIVPIGSDVYLGAREPAPRSAAEQVCEVITQKATIVQVALMPLAEGASFQVALENNSMFWDTPAAGDAAAEMQAAIRAMGTITVPWLTSAGDTVDMSAVTVTEKFLINGLNN
jgi:hypothetical protein